MTSTGRAGANADERGRNSSRGTSRTFRRKQPSPMRGRAREDAILTIALELLGECGFERLTMDAIAARTHASKATIYGKWPSKDALVADALRRQAQGAEPLVAPDTGTLRGDLQQTLDNIAGALRGNHGVSLVSMVEAIRDHQELRETVDANLKAASNTVGQAIASHAAQRGELPSNADVPASIMLAVGHLLYATLFSGRVPDRTYRHQLVENVLLPMLNSAPKR